MEFKGYGNLWMDPRKNKQNIAIYDGDILWEYCGK